MNARRHTEDYYAILQVEPDASLTIIRQAYRRLALKYHPDKNPGNEDAARVAFERLLLAYEVLSDPHERLIYDRHARPKQRTYRPENPQDICYQVLDLLLSEQPQPALDAFERFLVKTNRRLDDLNLPFYLKYNEARDCEFLLAEAFENTSRFEDAVTLYELSLERERRRPYFREFTEEIVDRLKRLYFERFQRQIAVGIENGTWDGSFDNGMRAVFALGTTRRERAGYYKTLAERWADEQPAVAREALMRALDLAPKLGGVKKLCERLGVESHAWQPSVEPTNVVGDSV
ncbi:MAG: DnaJ domain-containing protein [Candidatus Poribacteria bacterium]|nr:DnaJ domain-containing protein [Candidatus Poribacteria bacterium]